MNEKESEALITRIAAMLHEPLELPDGCPPLGERIIGAIEMLYREQSAAKEGEYEAIVLQRAWAPVVQAALEQARVAAERENERGSLRWELQCRGTERCAEALTDDQKEAAEP